MQEFVLLEGQELDTIAVMMGNIAQWHSEGKVTRLRIAIDGGLKVKVNENTWTPPYGPIVPANT